MVYTPIGMGGATAYGLCAVCGLCNYMFGLSCYRIWVARLPRLTHFGFTASNLEPFGWQASKLGCTIAKYDSAT